MITPYSVGTTEVRIATKQADRTSIVIKNNHATATIYWRNSKGVVQDNGFPIAAGGANSLKIPEDDPTDEFWCISDTLATDVRVYEGFGVKR